MRALTGDKHLLPIAVALLAALVLALQIWNSDVPPRFDQARLIDYQFSRDGYPDFDAGISSRLIVGIHNQLTSWEPVTTSAQIRTIAMLIYVGAGLLLFTAMPGPVWLSLLFLLLLLTSRFPYLWLASELFAGAFLMLILWSAIRRSIIRRNVVHRLPFAITAFFVVLFSLAKPDLIISGLVAGLYLAYAAGDVWKERLGNAAVLLGLLLLFLLPGLLREGPSYVRSQGRALYSLRQHYGALVQKHQMVSERPDPWQEWEPYFLPVWGDTESIPQLIGNNPHVYLDFLFLSAARSLFNFLRANALFLLPLATFAFFKIERRHLQVTIALLLSGFIPIALLSFVHVRYLARFYPLFLFPIYHYLAFNHPTTQPSNHPPSLRAPLRLLRGSPCNVIITALIFLLAWQTYQFIPVASQAHWFPD